MLYSYGGFGRLVFGDEDVRENLMKLKQEIESANAILIGAGSGLSTAAGYVYTGANFEKYFGDFGAKYGFKDMYSGGFYPYRTMAEFWGFWSRYIWINRYAPIPTDLYEKLYDLVKGKDYFVLTTNVDHCFQRAGFDRERLFYTQGDYGLFQSMAPHGASVHKTYDNYDTIRQMVLSQGWTIAEDGNLKGPVDGGLEGSAVAQGDCMEGPAASDGATDFSRISMAVSDDLIPYCPDDGELMTTNLRSDDKFVEDAGWHAACDRYQRFQQEHERGHVLYLELGVGLNTPVIIKYPFWQMTQDNPEAVFATINKGQAICPAAIEDRSILVDGDIAECVQVLDA